MRRSALEIRERCEIRGEAGRQGRLEPQIGPENNLPPGSQIVEKKPETCAGAEVDEVRRNPLITGDPVGLSSNDAGPRVVGEGVALSLGRPFAGFNGKFFRLSEQAGTAAPLSGQPEQE